MFVKGYKQSKRQKNRIAKALKNNKNAKGKMLAEKHPHWAGKKAGYSSIHSWVRRNFGKPAFCTKCNKLGKKLNTKWTIQWCNKSGKYIREKFDWISLCTRCHSSLDNFSERMRLIWIKRKLQSKK